MAVPLPSSRRGNACAVAWMFALWLLTTVVPLTTAASSSSSQCQSADSEFFCPNCGGISVTDCLTDCPGFTSTDSKHGQCMDRVLFGLGRTKSRQTGSTGEGDNTDNDDSDTNDDSHYHFLVNDIVAAVVWFVMAGIATACGVGGGGIYVPLGMLLLQFAPKQASGLSQASIFGASLGGLLLNARAQHPMRAVRNVEGVVEEEEADAAVLVDETNGTTNSNNNNTAVKEEETATRRTVARDEAVSAEGVWYTRPIINYDMALFLAPMEMAGAVLGVLVQKILPNWLYLLIAGLVLSATAYKTFNKFRDVRAKEKKTEARLLEVNEVDHDILAETTTPMATTLGDNCTDGSVPLTRSTSLAKGAVLSTGSDDEETGANVSVDDIVVAPPEAPSETALPDIPAITTSESNSSSTSSTSDADQLRQLYLEQDARQYPKEKIFALVLVWIGLLVLTLLKGGKGVESLVGITCESPWYGVLIGAQFTWMFAFALVFGRQLVQKQAARVAVRYPYQPDDPVWTMATLRFYGAFTFVAGIVAGLIGIGGGMVLGPLMLIMGIHPRVSSATTATMIVLTSSSVAVIFVTSGLVPWSYAVFYFCVCLIGAMIGKSKIDAYVKRTGRASLLICMLATIIAFATIGCFVILFLRLSEKDWCFDGFNAFCTVESKSGGCPVQDRMLQSFVTAVVEASATSA